MEGPPANRHALRERLAASFEGAQGPFAMAVLRAVVQSVPSYIAAVRPTGELLYVRRFDDVHIPQEDGASVTDYLDAPSAEAALRCLAQVARTRVPGSFRCFVPRLGAEDGQAPAHYETRVAPLVEDGEVVALVLVATDVTAEEQARRALQASEESLALAVGATGMGIWSWDSRTDEVVWDDMLCHHFGLPPGQGVTTCAGYVGLVFPDDRPEVARSIEQAMETGTYQDLLHRIVVDGEIRWVLVKGRVLFDDAGRAIGLLGGVFDVTERRRLDLELRERQKIQAVGELAAGVAHNFNNMLTAIMGNLSTLEASVGPSLREHVDAAMVASVAAAEVVRDLGSLTRRERNRTRRRIPLRGMVEQVRKIVRSTFTPQVQLELDDRFADGDDPWIEVLGGDLEHALLNLCLNARDAAAQVPEPRIRLTIRRCPPRPGDRRRWLEIDVRDNGVGMDDGTRARIFEPFFTTKAEGGGTGMGLFTAHRTVNEHGGLLEVQSTPGEGSTFSILLPESSPPG